MSGFKRLRVATVPFFMNLSRGGEASPEGEGWRGLNPTSAIW